MEVAKVHSLQEMVDYQQSAVVSKAIVKKDTGNVTLFSFDREQGLSEHTAPFEALVYIVEGQAQIIIDGGPHDLKAGELIVLPANHPHAVKAKTQFKMLLVMIKS